MHRLRPGRVLRPVAQHRDPVVDRALMIALHVLLDREEIARARILGVDRQRLAERVVRDSVDRVGRQRLRLAERRPDLGLAGQQLGRLGISAGGIGVALRLEIRPAERAPALAVVGVRAHPRFQARDRGRRVGGRCGIVSGGSGVVGRRRRGPAQPDRRDQDRRRARHCQPAEAPDCPSATIRHCIHPPTRVYISAGVRER